MNTLEMTIENRKRIITLENAPPYNQNMVLTRLVIVEQNMTKLVKLMNQRFQEFLNLKSEIMYIKQDIETLSNSAGVSLL